MDTVNMDSVGTDAGASPNMHYLCFLRWMADRGELEHAPLSSPRGEFVLSVRWPSAEGKYLVIA